MEERQYNLQDPIAALATPWGESAVAVIRTSGGGAIQKVGSLLADRENLEEVPAFRIVRTVIADPDDGTELDDLLLAVYRGPNSYTGEDSVELFVHGSLPGIQRILEALHRVGFRDANPGEFTLRAFVNGKLDLTRAEAVHEIVTAKTKQAQSLALHRLGGSIENAVNGIKTELTDLLGLVELQLDYSEDEGEAEDRPISWNVISGIRNQCVELAETFSTGRLYQQGVRVVLAGKTNAGKSSLFNLFLKEDRSIVSEIHGTTRDYIESWITLRGVPVKLYDTAGLRLPDNPVESEGIRRTEEVLGQADIVLYIVDATAGIDDEDRRRLAILSAERPCIRIWNKVDAVSAGGAAALPEGYYPLSTVEVKGFHEIEDAIVSAAAAAVSGSVTEGTPVIDSLRQKELLDRAVTALDRAEETVRGGLPIDMTAMELHDALRALGEITGEVTSADILNSIFSRFCVGK